MRIISWNVNGLRAVYRKNFLEFLEQYSPDILLLQEVKALPEQLTEEELAPLNYQSIFSPAQKKGYSGVAIYYRKDLKIEIVAKGINHARFDDEGRFLIIKVNDLLIYNIYFPSGTTGDIRQNFKEEFLDSITKHFRQQLLDPSKKIVIGGDFNICHQEIDIHHPKQASKLGLSGFLPQERSWFSDFLDLNFCDSFRSIQGTIPNRYSWWSYRAGARGKNLGWRIDYFLLSRNLESQISNADILDDCLGSDHAPIILDLKN